MAFALLTPRDAEEAVRLLAEAGAPKTRVLAGGTDLLFELEGGRPAPARLLSLRRLPWRFVGWDGPRLTVGSTAPLSDVEREPRVPRDLPGLWMAIRAVGSVPLRHRATIGGNLGRASPASDLIPVLLALDARVHLVGPSGARELSVGEFIVGPRTTSLGPAELIEAVSFPEPRPSSYLWQRVRPANDISQVGVAAAWSPSEQRWGVAVGGAWPAPTRLAEVERELVGATPSEAHLARAAALAARLAPFQTDKRASEEYRRRVLDVLLRRAVRAAEHGRGSP